MTARELSFRIDTSSVEDIRTHLLGCDRQYCPRLSERVDIGEYSRKIREHALTAEAWEGETLAGLVAAYPNALERSCYITNVSVLPDYGGNRLATKLLSAFVRHAHAINAATISLEVSKASHRALRLYARFGFRTIDDRGDRLLMRRHQPQAGDELSEGPAR